jgi:hypothetical protein
MANDPREIRRKLRVLEHAEASGDVNKSADASGSDAQASTGGVMRCGRKAKPGWRASGQRC